MPPEPLSDQSTNNSMQQQAPKTSNVTHSEATVPPAEPNSTKTDDSEPYEPTVDVEEGERQNDVPQVKEFSVDASKNPDYNFPQDEPVPEDEVEEELPAKPITPVHTESKKKSK